MRPNSANNGVWTEMAVVEFVRWSSRADVVVEEPDKLAWAEVGHLVAVSIVSAHLDLLCVCKFCTELSMNVLEAGSEVCSSRNRGRWGRRGNVSDAQSRDRMIPCQSVERRNLRQCVLGVIECKLSQWEVIDPVVLLV